MGTVLYKGFAVLKFRPLLYLRDLIDEITFILAEAEDNSKEKLTLKLSAVYSLTKEYPVLLIIRNGYVVPEGEIRGLIAELRRLGLKPVLKSREKVEGEYDTLFGVAVILPFTATIEVIEG